MYFKGFLCEIFGNKSHEICCKLAFIERIIYKNFFQVSKKSILSTSRVVRCGSGSNEWKMLIYKFFNIDATAKVQCHSLARRELIFIDWSKVV